MSSNPRAAATTRSSKPKRGALIKEQKIDLFMPLNIEGAEVGQLTMRFPTVKDRTDADEAGETQAETEVFLMARLTNLAPSDFQDMHLADYKQCQEALGKFVTSPCGP